MWGSLNTQLELYAPALPGLESNLSALEIVMDGVEVESPGAAPLFVATDVRKFLNPMPEWGQDYLKESIWLQASIDSEDRDSSGGEVAMIRGRLIHRLPEKLYTLSLDISKLGNKIEYNNGFRMQLVATGMGRIEVEMRGDRARVMQLAVRDEAGETMMTQKPTFTSNEPAVGAESSGGESFQASIQISSNGGGRPQTLDVTYALALDEEFYTFELPTKARSDTQTASAH